jgi:hypothetical protein
MDSRDRVDTSDAVQSKRISVHVTAAEVPILERFKEQGGNVSELLRKQLHTWWSLEKLKAHHDLIELDMGPDKRNKQFIGTWIHTWRDPNGEFAGVAHTKKGSYLLYFRGPKGYPYYSVHEKIEEIQQDGIRHTIEAIMNNTAEFIDV